MTNLLLIPWLLQSLKDLGRVTYGMFLKVFRNLVGLFRRGID